MSTFYKEKFVSPLPLFAEVKETLRSYFNSGVVDDLLFPRWLEHCMRRFRKSQYTIEQTCIEVCDYSACLPDGFNSVREVWLCTNVIKGPYRQANAYYYQKDCRVTSVEDACAPCFTGPNNPLCCDDDPNCNSLLPFSSCTKQYTVTNKITGDSYLSFHLARLLQPGNLNAKKHCGGWSHNDDRYCGNLHSFSPETFDIVDGKIFVDFPTGHLYMQYYAETTDDNGEQMIPDNEWLHEYIRQYLVYKCFEQISNQVTDETFNQIESKLNRANQKQEEAYITAKIEMKKIDIYTVNRLIIRDYNRLNKFKLPDWTHKSRWWRNYGR